MTPFFLSPTQQRQQLTNLTLAVLQDTGWYVPRWQYGMALDIKNLPTWGSQSSPLSCNLATSPCQQFQSSSPGSYYCNPSGGSGGSGGGGSKGGGGGGGVQSQCSNLACFSFTSPAACDSTPFSNGCGVLRPANLQCSSTNVLSNLPSGSSNLLIGIPGGQWSSNVYAGFGAAYGPGSYCLPWTNSTGQRYPGCFLSSCSGGGSTVNVVALVNGAMVSIPCPAGTSVTLSSYLPVSDASSAIMCPTWAQTQAICNGASATGQVGGNICPGSGTSCVMGTCQPGGGCLCNLEYMGSDCSLHVGQVSDFNNPGSRGTATQVSLPPPSPPPPPSPTPQPPPSRPPPRKVGGQPGPASGPSPGGVVGQPELVSGPSPGGVGGQPGPVSGPSIPGSVGSGKGTTGGGSMPAGGGGVGGTRGGPSFTKVAPQAKSPAP